MATKRTSPSAPDASSDSADMEKIENMMGPPPRELKKKVVTGNFTEPVPKEGEIELPTKIELKDESSDSKMEGDNTTDQAIDDIVAKEGDAVLDSEDVQIAEAFRHDTPQTGFISKVKSFVRKWWENKRLRWATFVGIALAIVLLGAIPTTRYALLNTVGVRVSASLQITDESTRQPLKNVTVSIAGQSVRTNEDGVATFPKQLKLGSSELKIEKRAFASIEQTRVLGWGSNPLGTLSVRPVGAQYSFMLKDFLSGKAIKGASAATADADAKSDDTGKLVITLDTEATQSDTAEVIITQRGFRSETVTLNLDTKEPVVVAMVPDRPHVFVSKRSGKFDIYKSDIDGKNEALLLAATGTERDDMTLLMHPTRPIIALVSTRDNVKNKDGFVLSGLYMLNIQTGETQKVVQSEQVRLVGWVGERLVYVNVGEGTSASSPDRNKLMSYHLDILEAKELARSNYFNDVLIMKGNIFYAPSNAYNDAPDTQVYRVAADGTNRQSILPKEGWNIFRTGHDSLHISVQQDWYTYAFDTSQAVKGSAPAILKSRYYAENLDQDVSVWVDERDGQGVLLIHSEGVSDDKVLLSKAGLQYPVYWLSDSTLVFRVSDGRETADYAVSIDGGEAVKIKDVTAVSSVDEWYYYY